jgi:hypothetical protein
MGSACSVRYVHTDVQPQAEELGKVLSQMKLVLQGTQGSSNLDMRARQARMC